MIGIINYGSGNVYAIANLHNRASIPHFVSDDVNKLKTADKLILPGVGAFDETMQMLKRNGLKDFLDEQVLVVKKPIIGVCVGMQILGESSEEGSEPGFGWIKGKVNKIDKTHLTQKPYLPHLGWNSIQIENKNDLLEGIDYETGFYYLHSYYFECKDENDIVATSVYGKNFACCINHENVFGVQFHPEKSHSNGIQLFKNYANL
jgi:imidazole glycerol-phosphate synthase subunit HisH